jgi:adenylate cyclase
VALEIERKFLVASDEWRQQAEPGVRYRQGYLSAQPRATVRVRVAGERAFLTVKGEAAGLVRPEFEYAIPLPDAEAMLAGLCGGPLVEKTRYRVPHSGHIWEVDVFEGDNAGLVVAELELTHPDEPFARPPWLGREVTGDARYLNARLARYPYRTWPQDG